MSDAFCYSKLLPNISFFFFIHSTNFQSEGNAYILFLFFSPVDIASEVLSHLMHSTSHRNLSIRKNLISLQFISVRFFCASFSYSHSIAIIMILFAHTFNEQLSSSSAQVSFHTFIVTQLHYLNAKLKKSNGDVKFVLDARLCLSYSEYIFKFFGESSFKSLFFHGLTEKELSRLISSLGNKKDSRIF